MYTIQELNSKKVSELRDIASESNVPKNEKLRKQDLIYAILDVQAETKETKKSDLKKQEKSQTKDFKKRARKESPSNNLRAEKNFKKEKNFENNKPNEKKDFSDKENEQKKTSL